MKKNKLFLGITALALVFAFVLTGCPKTTDGGGGDPKVDTPTVGSLPAPTGSTSWVAAEDAAETLYNDVKTANLGNTFCSTIRYSVSPGGSNFDDDKNLSGVDYLESASGTVHATIAQSISGSETSATQTMTTSITANTDGITASSITVSAGSVWKESVVASGSSSAYTSKMAAAYGITVVKNSVAAKIIYTSNTTQNVTVAGATTTVITTGSETVKVYGENDAEVWTQTTPISENDSFPTSG